MRRIVLCVCLTGAVGFAPAPLPRPERGRGEPGQADLAAMQGRWSLTFRSNGVKEVKGRGWSLVLSGARMQCFLSDGNLAVEYAVALNAKAGPKAMDLLRLDDQTVWKGTYSLRGDRLVLTFALMGPDREKRPAACEPAVDRQYEVYERVRP
jgi:uncharacterized protein (TIGR03067 family)